MTYELVLLARDVGDVHVVGRGGEVLKLLAGEDIDGNQVNLGVTVLSSLGGRHVDNLARATLDDDVTVLAQSRALHGKGQGRAGVGGLEGVIMLQRGQLRLYSCYEENGSAVLMVVDCNRAEMAAEAIVWDVGYDVPPLAMRGGNLRCPQIRRNGRVQHQPRQPW